MVFNSTEVLIRLHRCVYVRMVEIEVAICFPSQNNRKIVEGTLHQTIRDWSTVQHHHAYTPINLGLSVLSVHRADRTPVGSHIKQQYGYRAA